MTEEAKRIVESLRDGAKYQYCLYCASGELQDCRDEPSCVLRKAADLIEQLSAERNAAVEDAHGICSACIHFNARYNPGDIMICCKFEECIHGADDFNSEDHWQWRGLQEEQ